MIRTQVQLPRPLHEHLKTIAAQHEWSLAEVLRKAAEHFADRFPVVATSPGEWRFPMLDGAGDFSSARPNIVQTE